MQSLRDWQGPRPRRGDISCEIRTHDLDLDLDLIQQGPPAAPDGECDEQGEQEGCDKLGTPCRQTDKGRLEGDIQGPGGRECSLRSRIVEPQRVRLGVDREDADRPDDEDRHAHPEHPSRGVGERSLSEQKENVEKFLPAQAGLNWLERKFTAFVGDTAPLSIARTTNY